MAREVIKRLQNIGLAVGKEVWPRLRIEGGISSIRWKNARFNPFSPTADGPDPKKTSFSLGIYYNFKV